MLRRRRLCFPATAAAALENFGQTMWKYSLLQLALQPTWLSSRLRVARVVPVKDSVFSWFFLHRPVSCRRSLIPKISFLQTQWLGRPIFSQLLTLLPIPPAAACVLNQPVSLSLPADVSRVAVSSSLTFSAS